MMAGQDDFLFRQDMLRTARGKVECGQRLGDEELKAFLSQELREKLDGIFTKAREIRESPEHDREVRYTQGTADSIRHMVSAVYAELVVNRFHAIRNREALEDRVAALEAKVKPKVRVAARSRRGV